MVSQSSNLDFMTVKRKVVSALPVMTLAELWAVPRVYHKSRRILFSCIVKVV